MSADRGSRHTPLEEERGTSWLSVILGWLTALGAGLILSGIVSDIVGAIFGTAGRQGLTEGGVVLLRPDGKPVGVAQHRASATRVVFRRGGMC